MLKTLDHFLLRDLSRKRRRKSSIDLNNADASMAWKKRKPLPLWLETCSDTRAPDQSERQEKKGGLAYFILFFSFSLLCARCIVLL